MSRNKPNEVELNSLKLYFDFYRLREKLEAFTWLDTWPTVSWAKVKVPTM